MAVPKKSVNQSSIEGKKEFTGNNDISAITTKIMEKTEGSQKKSFRIVARVTEDLKDQVSSYARKEGRTEGDALRMIITQYFTEHPLD